MRAWTVLRRWPPVRRVLPVARALACAPAAAVALLAWRAHPPVDRDWYAEQGFTGRRGHLLHYLLVGRRAGRSPHPLLEPAWVAPVSWRRPWPEPLLGAGGRRSTHPVLAPGALTVARAGTLGADELLPVVTGGEVRYGVLRDAAVAAARAHAEQEALRLLPRVVERWTAPPVGAPFAAPAGLPSVTVVMPVLDRPLQVVEAIASVQAQTVRDWQLVVVDDGSIDATPDVVAALAARDDRIQLVRADHGGVSAARNRGTSSATGQVLGWLDSDNTWAPDYLRQMLTALARTGAECAYAVLEQRTGDGVRYRALDAGLDALRLQNHVDLNVLVARRSVVEAVGGFDPTLRRAVDYDLVLRLAERGRPLFVPVVGARYDERREASDRITVREAKTWSDVVRARRLVGWDALDAGAASRSARLVSVVVPLARTVPPSVFVPALRTALDGAGGEVEVVVVDAGGSRATGTALAGMAAVDGRLRVLRWPAPMTPGWALAYALGCTSGSSVVTIDADAVLSSGYDLALRERLRDRPVVVSPGVLAVRAVDLVAVRGADALQVSSTWRDELALRIEARAPA